MAQARETRVLFEENNGRKGYRVRFYHVGKRRSIWLSNESESVAKVWAAHVDHIASQYSKNQQPSKPTLRWIDSLSVSDRLKLENAGLVESLNPVTPSELTSESTAPTLQTLIDRFMPTVSRNKSATIIKIEQAGRCLTRFPSFGPSITLDKITAGLAEEWVAWLTSKGNVRDTKRSELGSNTVRRRTGLAKQIFSFAVRHEWIKKNPFDGLVSTVNSNDERMQFVDIDTTIAVLNYAPDAKWRAIIALARFGGLRIPSELARLTWADINFEHGKIRIHSSKTEHHAGKGIRYCPLFPELREYLEDLLKLATDENGPPALNSQVIPGMLTTSNLRTTFEKIITKAGVEQWPKLFQNLRASRETELMAIYPIKDVCTWIGNSPSIAMKHYAMVTSKSFDSAIEFRTAETRRPTRRPNDATSEHHEAQSDFGDINENVDNSTKKDPQSTQVHLAGCIENQEKMGDIGLEPTTPTMSTWCSNQLS